MASDSGDGRNPENEKDASAAQKPKRAAKFKASELLASAQTPDTTDLPADASEIVTLPGGRKNAGNFKASDLLGVAPTPAASDRPAQKLLTKTRMKDLLSRRKRADSFKASEMLAVAPPVAADAAELPHQTTTVEKRDLGPREVISGLLLLFFAGVIGWILVGRQQEDAQRTVCAGNLRDISLALLQYAQDNDESLPNRLTGWPDTVTAWNAQEGYTWRRAIAPYFKNRAAFRCPTNPNNTHPAGCQVVACGVTRVTDGFDTSYACNYNTGLGGGDEATGDGFCGGKGASPVRLSGFASPSQMIAVVEAVTPWSEFNVLKPTFGDAIYTGHHGLSNYLFADGHVAPLAPVQTLNFWRGDSRRFSLPERETARAVLGVR